MLVTKWNSHNIDKYATTKYSLLRYEGKIGLHNDQFYSRDDMTMAQGIIAKQKWSTGMLTLLMKIKNTMSPVQSWKNVRRK